MLGRDAVTQNSEHPLGDLAVGRRTVILIKGLQLFLHALELRRVEPVILADQRPGDACGLNDLGAAQQRFGEILQTVHIRGPALDGLPDQRQRLAVLLLTGGIGVDPLGETLLGSELRIAHLQLFQSAALADRVFPVIRRHGILRRILDANLVAGQHVLHHQLLTLAANENAVRIVRAQRVVDLIGSLIALGRSRKADDHREAPRLVPFQRNGQMGRSGVRHVILAVFGRLPVTV